MDPQQDHQKDFVPAYFPIDGDAQRPPANSLDGLSLPVAMYNPNSLQMPPPQSQQQQQQQALSSSQQQASMDMLNLMASLQGSETHIPMPQATSTASTSSLNPQLLLEQQFKFNQLRQLQQLQQQIFQQQLAIISSNQNSMIQDPQLDRTTNYHGLPTPNQSSEILPQHSNEFVSPMSLQQMPLDMRIHAQSFDNQMMTPPADTIDTSRSHPRYSPRGSASAPAHVAFRSSPEFHALPSPAELEFDAISPLASPWLQPQASHMQSYPPHASTSSAVSVPSQKRTASPSSAEQMARKKQSPAIRPTNPSTKKSNNTSRGGSKSVNSTPLLRSTRSRKGSVAGELVGDTPSPVDLSLSMPPPASTSHSNGTTNNIPPSPGLSAQLTPVTPASIMKLGRLGVDSSLTPKSFPQGPSANRIQKKSSTGIHASPGLKAILPAGATPSATTTSAQPQPIMQVRKTSHKAAEQKRRDSLKTTFDDLRGLLPPIPLPNDEKFPEEPLLPGALPPRGPPKAGNDGPNKGVSKLQLLICGNDYIRRLKGRVERRDDEIEKLRKEVKRLRLHMVDKGIPEADGDGGDEDELDLERDLDAVEATMKSKTLSVDGEMDGDEDMGDEV